jgi:hypothetical protein
MTSSLSIPKMTPDQIQIVYIVMDASLEFSEVADRIRASAVAQVVNDKPAARG